MASLPAGIVAGNGREVGLHVPAAPHVIGHAQLPGPVVDVGEPERTVQRPPQVIEASAPAGGVAARALGGHHEPEEGRCMHLVLGLLDHAVGGPAVDGHPTDPADPGPDQGQAGGAVLDPELEGHAMAPLVQEPQDEIPVRGVRVDDVEAMGLGQRGKLVAPAEPGQHPGGQPASAGQAHGARGRAGGAAQPTDGVRHRTHRPLPAGAGLVRARLIAGHVGAPQGCTPVCAAG